MRAREPSTQRSWGAGAATRWVRVPRTFYRRDATAVARDLLGLVLQHESGDGLTAGRIVETEAYLSAGDPASHAYAGPTQRNRAMFGSPGHAYVYLIYGVHHCFNVVTGPKHVGEAVLIRALEPVAGIELMRQRRPVETELRLCNGPGNLVRAMGLGLEHDGADLVTGAVGIWAPKPRGGRSTELAFDVGVSRRVGITAAADLPLRFFIAGSHWVSRVRP